MENSPSINSYLLPVYLLSRSKIAMEEFVEYTNAHEPNGFEHVFMGGKLFGMYSILKTLAKFVIEPQAQQTIEEFGRKLSHTILEKFHDTAVAVAAKVTQSTEEEVLESLERMVREGKKQYKSPKPSDLN